ncbi:NAD-P-binding protein [Dentipellis sp. KUC8613]|nr:NAD-P-binding protein [Dentipellis sp. KUC8613]
MAPVAAPAKALVTGANGFIAVWVVRRLLEAGYSVRGTVRSADKGAHLREIFKSYGDKLELVVVPDITAEGAFDEAVKGIDLVEHTASPFTYKADTPDDLIAPAVKGTVGVLESIKKNAPSVKRVVVTASVASIVNPFLPGPVITYDESCWNDATIDFVEKNPKDSPSPLWYLASKTLAEKAAWDFVEKNKSAISFDLVVLNPPYVYGPTLHEVNSPMKLNQSLLEVYQFVIKSKDTLPFPDGAHTYIDVRDLADAHVLSAQKADAGGNRIIVSGGNYHWQDILDIAAASKIIDEDKLVKGTPGAGAGKTKDLTFKTDRSDKLLGIKWISLEDSIKDSLASFKEKNFV